MWVLCKTQNWVYFFFVSKSFCSTLLQTRQISIPTQAQASLHSCLTTLHHPAHWVAQKLHVCVISKWFCSASSSTFPWLCRSELRSHILQETLLISWAALCSLSDHWYPVDVNIFSHCFTTFPFWFISSWRIVSSFILLYVRPLASKRQRQKRCPINVHQMELTCIQSQAQTHQSFSSKPLPSSR